ncbi:hypothetical protein FS837_011566 [Tulasnella sp. UAMH 9824]|nr:hypothetical protein FS837_011566 [Tulasnella sp. UAMH 9824]
MPQNLGSNAPVIDILSPTDALNPAQATYSGSNFPIYRSPAPLAPALAPLTNSSSRSQPLVPVSQAGLEVLDDRTRLAPPNAHHAEAQEFRSGQSKDVTSHATSGTPRCNTTVTVHQPADEQHVPAIKASTKTPKQRVEGRNKWWEMGGKLRDTRRHFRREAVDFGNPNAPYCNAEQIANEAYALKRGRANKRRDRLQNHHDAKHPHASTADVEDEPIFPQDVGENVPLSAATTLPTLKIQQHYSNLAVVMEGPHQPAGWVNDHPNSTQHAVSHLPFSTVRHPLGSLDINVVLNGGVQEAHDTGLAENPEDGDNALDDTRTTSRPATLPCGSDKESSLRARIRVPPSSRLSRERSTRSCCKAGTCNEAAIDTKIKKTETTLHLS